MQNFQIEQEQEMKTKEPVRSNTLFIKIKHLIKKYSEMIRYLIVGALTTIVSLGSYYLCIYTVFDPANPILLQCANAVSWVMAVTFAYVTNRKYVFRSKDPHVFREAAAFYTGRVGTLLLDMGFMALFVSILSYNPSLMKLLGQLLITAANYLISKLIVFRHT